MTTKVTISTHGWPVQVMTLNPATGAVAQVDRVEAGATERTFYLHSTSDLHLHEIQSGEDGSHRMSTSVEPSASAAGPDAPKASLQGLPVAGYRPQSATAVEAVNGNKEMEEVLLRLLDAMQLNPEVDKRWLAIGRTHLEQGFMAINRSIFRPARVELAG